MTSLGNIPETLGNLTNLRELSLWGNQFSGTYPRVYPDLRALSHWLCHQETYQKHSEISRTFKRWLFLEINFRVRTLVNPGLRPKSLLTSLGSIPETLRNLTNLQTLDLSGNQLSGTYPTYIQICAP
jgi:Leucine-rich repeat (LRR) protein